MNLVGENRPICLVCRKQVSQYTCPRCNLRYCSLRCYSSHSTRCLESFHRDHVLAEMQHLGPSSETQNRMLQALKRFHEYRQEDEDALEGLPLNKGEDQDDDDTSTPSVLSEATLERLASGESIKFNDLSDGEKKAFLHAVASGELRHMIKPWDPWWLKPFAKCVRLNKEGNRLVQLAGSPDQMGSSAGDSDVPLPLQSPLPPLKHLTPVQPSPLLGLHLCEVLYSYCFTLRLYNGDWLSDAVDAAVSCLCISHVLGQSASPETISAALSSCIESVCSPLFKSAGGKKFALGLLDDTVTLLRNGRGAVVCALSDLHRMYEGAVENFKQGNNTNVVPRGPPKHTAKVEKLKLSRKPVRADLRQFAGVAKKIYFLLCWANEQSDEILGSLAMLVEGEKGHFIEATDGPPFMNHMGGVTQTVGRKLVIEEISTL